MSEMAKAAKEAIQEAASAVPVEHSMRFKVAMMTPEWASELLKHNHPNNRRVKWGKVAQYVRDMESGCWRLTHQGIAVDEQGSLIEAGYGSAARFMMIGIKGVGFKLLTHQQIINFAYKHREALDFTFECMGKNQKGISTSPVRAVVARAWYKKGARMRLRLFCEVLMTGLMDNAQTDRVAIKLRNWLQEQLNRGGERKKIYAKATEALSLFLDGKDCDRLGFAIEEAFPLPDEPMELDED